MMDERKRKEDLLDRIQAERSVGRAAGDNETKIKIGIQAATAQNILHDDLGMFADSDGPAWAYDLEPERRDRLLAHARQDAAHAVVVGTDIYKAVASLNTKVNVLLALVICLLGLLFWAMRPF